MLVPISLSLFWAIASTVFILPWFWIGLIKRKTIIGSVEYRGFSSVMLKQSIIEQILGAVIIFFVSLMLYLVLTVRYNLYGSTIQILLVLIFQIRNIYMGWNDKRKEKARIIAGIACILFIVSIIDVVTTYDMSSKLDRKEIPIVVSINEKEKVPSSNTIKNLFKADSVSDPVYSNGKVGYVTVEGPNGDDGVVIIDEKNADIAIFVACNYKVNRPSKVREKYPFDRIEILNMVISNNNVPYGKYAVLDKPIFFARPTLKKYLLQDLITGEIVEYSVDKLPKFAE